VSAITTLQEGEELVRRLLEAVPGGVVHVAPDGAILRASPEARRLLGLAFDEASQRYLPPFFDRSRGDHAAHGEDGAPVSRADHPVTKALATAQSQPSTTLAMRAPDAATSWTVWRAEPVLDADGNVTGAIATFLDVTERRRAEEELRFSADRWRGLAENLPDFVMLAERDGTIVSINRVLPHLDEAKVVGAKLFDFLDPSVRAAYARELTQALDTRTSLRLETRGEGPEGSVVWYETQLVPLVEGGGAAARVLVVSRDVTERRGMLASLAEKERLASVGMLAASVAHEIMNPLTYVLANLDLVVGERSVDPERRARAVIEAREGARRMQQIVWDLRALGRAGGDELFYVDARSVLEIALRLSGPDVQRTASVLLDLGDVPGVFASESRLCQVFINLLVNAAHAMEKLAPESRELRIRTRYDDHTGLVGVDVSDNGEGIPADRLPRLFEPFYTTKRDGTGLGLSICRDIVERMGGRIDVASTLGAGTTFTVWLSTTRPAPPSGAPSTRPKAYR
jgi:PAS domain S-box-containing protein